MAASASPGPSALGRTQPRLVADLEPELFAQAFRLAQGNQAQAARWLGITRLKMHDKLVQFGLHPARNPAEAPGPTEPV